MHGLLMFMSDWSLPVFQTHNSIGMVAVLAQSGYSLQQRDMHHHQNSNCIIAARLLGQVYIETVVLQAH